MKKALKLCSLATLVLTALAAMSKAPAEEDWEHWMKYSISVRLNEKIDLFVKPQFRFRDDFSEFYYSRTWAGFSLKVTTWLDAAPQYTYKTSKQTGDHWPPENSFALDLTPKVNLSGFKISDRNRIMYGLDDYIWIYRNRIKIAYPFKKALMGRDLTPFIADEGFWSDGAHGFYENQAECGLGMNLIKNVGVDLSYIRRSQEKKEKWIDSHILCLQLNFKF